MRTSSKKLLVTSPVDPELPKHVKFSKWGGNKEHQIKPFQVKEICSSGNKIHLEGISKRRLKRFLENPGSSKADFYFYPNDIVTLLDKPGAYYVRKSIDHYSESEGKEYKETLANLYFCFVDFDPVGGTEEQKAISRDSFLEKTRSFELPPDVIIDSGNGLHAYWSIKHIHVLRDYDEEIHPALNKFEKVQKALANYFDCDPSTGTGQPRVMRIPGSWNIKKGKKRMCKPIYGDLVTARSKPVYTLNEIYTFLWNEKIIPRNKKVGRKKRPKPHYDGWREAMLKVQQHLNLGRLSEQFKRSFKFYYGHLRLGHAYEGNYNRKKVLGTNGREIKKARDRLVELGLIEIKSLSDYKNKKAMKIAFTDLFYKLSGVEKRKWTISPEQRQRVIHEVIHSECPEGQRRALMPYRLNKLILDGGIRDPELLEEILCQWIENRPLGLPRHTDGIDYLLRENRYINKPTKP